MKPEANTQMGRPDESPALAGSAALLGLGLASLAFVRGRQERRGNPSLPRIAVAWRRRGVSMDMGSRLERAVRADEVPLDRHPAARPNGSPRWVGRLVCACCALIAHLAIGIGAAHALPVFSLGYGIDTTNAPFTLAEFGEQPVSRSYSESRTDPFGLPGKLVSGSVSSDRGRIRITNRVRLFSALASNRAEVIASFSGDVYLCAEGAQVSSAPGDFDPGSCSLPGNPGAVPVPYPNISTSGTFTAGRGTGFVSVSTRIDSTPVYGQVSQIPLSNGDDAGTIHGVVSNTHSGTAVVTNCGAAGPCKVTVQVDVATLLGCGLFTRCDASIDMGNSVNFVEDGPAFVTLDPALSIWSPDLNIYDNRWYAPEFFLAADDSGPASVPEPSGLVLHGASLALLGLVSRRRRRTGCAVA